ncbi:MAG: hypothetical protein WKF84_12550 [Pyrinomonadaceae bacterium]
MVTLFLIGLWHLAIRLRDCFDRYTYKPKFIQDSIMRGEEPTEKPFTRLTAYAFLVVGYAISIATGLYMGGHVHYVVRDMAFLLRPKPQTRLAFLSPNCRPHRRHYALGSVAHRRVKICRLYQRR